MDISIFVISTIYCISLFNFMYITYFALISYHIFCVEDFNITF